MIAWKPAGAAAIMAALTAVSGPEILWRIVKFLLVLTLGALCFRDVSLESGGIGLLCGSLCGGAAAGLLGSGNRGSKRKKRRKR